MRIGLVIQSGISVGGAHNYETNFRNLLQEACDLFGHELVTFTSSSMKLETKDPNLITYKASPLRFVIAHLRSNALILSALRLIGLGKSHLEKKALNEKIDVLIFSSPNHLSPGIHSLPIVSTAWDFGHLDLPHYPETGLGGLWQWRDELYTTTIPRSILIFCDTENTRQTLVSRYRAYPDRVRVIGLLPSVPEQVEPEKLDKEHFIYPSMFWPHKNHTTLIDAFKKFIEEHGEVAYLVLTGEGRLRSAIEKVAQDSGISHLIRFEGLVTRSRLMSLIAGSRGLLMPSLLGPSNIPPLEAVLLGIPVAVSDAHSMETMLGQLEIVKGKSVQGWSRSFRKLYYREIEVPSILPLHESKTLASALTDLSDALIDSRLSEL